MSARLDRWAWRTVTAAVTAAALAVPLTGALQPSAPTTSEAREAPCLPGEPVPIMDSPHVSQARSSSVAYNSMPPTSGPHFAFTVAPGVYGSAIPDGLAVHALEHGHIVIRHAPTMRDSEAAALTRLAKRHGADVVLAPHPDLDRGIALTAWGRIDRLDRYDEQRITEFIERLRHRYAHGWTSATDCQ